MLRKYCCCNVFKGFKTDPFLFSFFFPSKKRVAAVFLFGRRKRKGKDLRKF
jgi:hypothetical protein